MNKVVRLFVVLTIVVSMGVVFVPPVKADTTSYNHIIPFTITDTSGVARTNLPVTVTYDVNGNLIAQGLVNATGTDTYMTSVGASNSGVGQSGFAATASTFMMSSGNVTFVIPSLPAFGSVTVNLYTGYSPAQTSFPIVTGNGGYVLVTDAAPIEPANNFDISSGFYVDTTQNETLVSKAGALGVTAQGGNITAALNYTSQISQAISNTAGSMFSNNWTAQTFTTVGAFSVGQVSVAFTAVGTPSSDLTLSIRATSGGVPSGADLVTTTVPSSLLTAGVNTITLPPYSLSGATVYAIVMRQLSANSSNSYGDNISNADPYAGGSRYVSSDSGVTWAISTGYDEYFVVSSPTVMLTKSGLSTGYYTTNVTSDGVNATLYVNGVAQDSKATTTISDNASSWVIGHNVPYMNYYKEVVSGTEVVYYQPTAMISTSTLINRDSGGSYPGTIYWGANSNLTISGEDIMDSASPTSVGVTSVMMQGSLRSIGTYSAVYLSFQYGLDTNYGYSTTEASVATPQPISVMLTGLTPNTTYHYRAVARNGVVYAYGADTIATTSYSTSSAGSTTPIIISARVFSGYITTGDWLVTAEVIDTYPPYYPTGNPQDYFQLQLIGTDGTTILGSSALRQWGDRPASIYFAPTANITSQSAYNVRLISISANLTSTTNHALVSTEWKGNNLSELDNWCIGVATNMQITDGVSASAYITSVTNTGPIITEIAGGYFTTGIPNINQVRPNLFATATRNNTVPTLSGSINYNAGTTLQGKIGTQMSNDANTVGAILGLTGQQFLLYSILAIILLFVAYTVSSTGGFGALGALCLSVPILGASAYLNILDIIVPVMLAVTFSILFVRQFIWKTL